MFGIRKWGSFGSLELSSPRRWIIKFGSRPRLVCLVTSQDDDWTWSFIILDWRCNRGPRAQLLFLSWEGLSSPSRFGDWEPWRLWLRSRNSMVNWIDKKYAIKKLEVPRVFTWNPFLEDKQSRPIKYKSANYKRILEISKAFINDECLLQRKCFVERFHLEISRINNLFRSIE